MSCKKATATSKSASVAWVLKQYMRHCLMQHVQGYTGTTGCSHRATIRSVLPRRLPGRQQTKQQCKMCPLCWPFRWPCRCAGNTACIARWRRSMAFLKATICCHRASTRFLMIQIMLQKLVHINESQPSIKKRAGWTINSPAPVLVASILKSPLDIATLMDIPSSQFPSWRGTQWSRD